MGIENVQLARGALYRLERVEDETGEIEPGVYAVAGESGTVVGIVLVTEAVDGEAAGRELTEYVDQMAEARGGVQLPNHGVLADEFSVSFIVVWPRRQLEVVE